VSWRSCAILVGVLAACRSGSTSMPEGGVDVRIPDAPVPRDGMAAPLAIDFTAGGCPSFTTGATGPRCRGPAPLTVQFVPVTTGAVTKYLWDFGDGTEPASTRTPLHTYSFPGSYDVALVGGGSAGSAVRTRMGFVVVVQNGAGGPCDVDQQCESGLRCLCGSAANPRCPAAFARGLCASSCKAADCRPTEWCADLTSTLLPGATAEPWQDDVCVHPCQSDTDCAPPLRCRSLPARAGQPDAGWKGGCFPDYPTAPGGRCRGASGKLQPELCVTGQCADLGSDGLCSLACASAPCPPDMGCADFSDGRHLCLPRCGPSYACDGDPLLACLGPNAGPLGFALHAGTPPGSYCAPRRCMSSDDCGPAGICHSDATGGHCFRKPD
jgi:PKD repeat protein